MERPCRLALALCGLTAVFLSTAAGACRAQVQKPAAAPRVTNLAGSRDRPGLFAQRLFLPAGFCGPIHTHDGDLHGLVLNGVLQMGFVDSAGRLDVREYPAGSFVPVPAGGRHVEGSPVDTEIHLTGVGPITTEVVDSTTPRRCTPAGQVSKPMAAPSRKPPPPIRR